MLLTEQFGCCTQTRICAHSTRYCELLKASLSQSSIGLNEQGFNNALLYRSAQIGEVVLDEIRIAFHLGLQKVQDARLKSREAEV